MRYVSVCSGIEAATAAWHSLGWTPVLFSEIEAFPRAVLQHRYPDVPLVGDFTELIANPPSADLLVGGTPCTSFSMAGKRLSLEDYRGSLSLAFADLFHAGNYQHALWENVPGVLSTKDNAFGCLLGRLVGADQPLTPGTKSGKWSSAGVVSGPKATAAWRILDAQYYGVAQRRRRVFVLVSRGAGNFSCATALFPVLEGVSGNPAPRRQAGQGVTGTLSASPSAGGGLGTDFECAGGVTIDRASGAVGCEVAATLKTDLSHQMGPIIVGVLGEVSHTLSSEGADASEDGTGRGTPVVISSHDPAVTLTAREAKGPLPEADMTTIVATSEVIAFSVKDYGADAGPVAPTLRAMGHQKSHINGGGQVGVLAVRTAQTSSNGHGFNADTAYTLDGTTGQAVLTVYRPRRLTPTEAERLQGFCDSYTLIPWSGKTGLAPDSLRYKALGNSMAVPVMRWLGKRIETVAKRVA